MTSRLNDLKSELDAVKLLIGLEHRLLGTGAPKANGAPQSNGMPQGDGCHRSMWFHRAAECLKPSRSRKPKCRGLKRRSNRRGRKRRPNRPGLRSRTWHCAGRSSAPQSERILRRLRG